jgi:uncharacterized protein YycO
MEAVTEYFFHSKDEEVQERPAYEYWGDGREGRDVYVLDHISTNSVQRDEAIRYARAQDPDPYELTSAKWTRWSWYCSKLVWASYKEATGDDLDSDWGYWVFPGDLEASGYLRTVYNFRYNG